MSDHYINLNTIPSDEEKALKDVVSQIKAGESLIISVDSNNEHQTDRLYDALVLNNFEVQTKTNRYNNQLSIIGVKKPDKH